MLTKYMGQELGNYNIRVNSVNPAAVYTNIYVSSFVYIVGYLIANNRIEEAKEQINKINSVYSKDKNIENLL